MSQGERPLTSGARRHDVNERGELALSLADIAIMRGEIGIGVSGVRCDLRYSGRQVIEERRQAATEIRRAKKRQATKVVGAAR
jgi:hypothetical protein